VLILNVLDGKVFVRRAKSGMMLGLIFAAILFNQRRLAWVSMIMGLVVCFVLLPAGKARRRATRIGFAFAPVLAVYVAVGWGRPETVFKPLRSLSTVTTQEDASTLARNAENLGLIATSNQSSMLFGTGWGHPYYEYSNKYSIARFFPLWQYVPHNSIL